MKFELTIDTDSQAMSDGADVGRALQRLGGQLARNELGSSGAIRDEKGAKVGHWKIEGRGRTFPPEPHRGGGR